LSLLSRWSRCSPARPSLGPPRGLPRKPSSFSQLMNNFVGPDKPTSVTGGDTPLCSGIAAPKPPPVIEGRRAPYSFSVLHLPADLISKALPQRPSGLNRIKIKSARRARRLQPLAMTVLLQKDDSRPPR